jgi:hypothetical protein
MHKISKLETKQKKISPTTKLASWHNLATSHSLTLRMCLLIFNTIPLIWKLICINPFPADVANKRHLGSAPKSHFCDLTGKIEVIGLLVIRPDLMTLFIDLGCLYSKQTQRAFNVFKNTLNWMKIDSVDQKLLKICSIDFSWLVCELLTRRWNVWHWERHCVFTAGGERVNRHQRPALLFNQSNVRFI